MQKPGKQSGKGSTNADKQREELIFEPKRQKKLQQKQKEVNCEHGHKKFEIMNTPSRYIGLIQNCVKGSLKQVEKEQINTAGSQFTV